MSGVLVIPNQFAAAVTATAGAIDVNFNSVTAYINDPTNRSNYVADASGATNTVNLTFSPPVVGGYTTGLNITWKWANTPTGPTIVNANAIGNSSLVNPDGSAIVGGQGIVGSIGHAVYDGTRFIYLTPPSPATKAQMQAATSSASLFVSPGQFQNHPSSPKVLAAWSGTATGTISPLYAVNVSTIVRNGTGTYVITFATAMTQTVFPCFAQHQSSGSSVSRIASTSATTAVVITQNSAFGALDVDFVHLSAYGPQ